MSKIEDIYPLSPLQQGILHDTLAAPDLGLYVDRLRFVIQSDLNVSAFYRSWQQLVDRHPVLRTGFAWRGVDEPLQIVLPKVKLPIAYTDWRGVPPEQQRVQLDTFFDESRFRAFDLAKPPLVRMTLIRLAEQTYEFVWCVHHLLLDGWSVSLLTHEFLSLYDALCRGSNADLERRRPYRDYLSWLSRQELSQAKSFWQQYLGGFATPTLIANGTTVDRSGKEGKQHLRFSTAFTARLRSFCRQHRLTLNTLLQGAWGVLLSRYANRRDVLFGAVVSGRPTQLPGAESMIGMFINTLPVRMKIQPGLPVLTWLKQNQAQQIESLRYQYSPLVKVQRWSDVPKPLSMFDNLLVFENRPLGTPGMEREGNLRVHVSIHHGSVTGYPLTLVVEPAADLTIRIAYDNGQFEAANVKCMLGHIQAVLADMISHVEKPLTEVTLLSDQERRQLLRHWNATATFAAPTTFVHELFEAKVESSPDAVAAVFEDTQICYGELNRRANRLAHHLRSLGVGTETVVGISVDRSLEMAVGLLGILKAGGAYLPLDPTYPQQRLRQMLVDADASVLLTQHRFASKLRVQHAKVEYLDGDDRQAQQYSTANPKRLTSEDHLAYVMYTSGSTGRPKGVMVGHRGICNYLFWRREAFPITANDHVLQKTFFGFDTSVWEFFETFMAGARLIMAAPGDERDAVRLAHVIRQYEVTAADFVPSMLQMFLDHEATSDCECLRRITTGGEALSVEMQRRFFERLPAQLYNGYGPTEATVGVSFWTCQRGDYRRSVPIGRPIANTQIYLLDPDMQPVPIGISGQLHIGGAGLARGYAGAPGVTAEKFAPDPFHESPGARLYRTGDLARYRADGNIEFLGRADNQVKIRGFRIELQEIESVLARHPKVAQVVVLAREDRPGDKRLVAYVVADRAPGTEQLRGFLEKRLPAYMVPSDFVMLQDFPTSANGKVDRKALPAPQRARARRNRTAPQNPVEELLCDIWADVLGLDHVNVTDSFFDVGGHSILAMRMISRVREALNVEPPIRSLWDAPTVADFAQSILLLSQNALPPTAILPVARNQVLPLSFEQQRLWFVDQLEAGNAAYNIAAAVRLVGPLNLDVLQRSVNEIVRRHEVLRTTFPTVQGQARQKTAAYRPQPYPVTDLSQLSRADREVEVRKLSAQQMRRPFDLSRGPLFRFELLRLDEHDHVAMLSMHHIISDEWSLGVMFRELAELYREFAQGKPSPLPPLRIQYADFAHWQRKRMQGEVLDAQLAYWKNRLGGQLPVLKLPLDRPRPKSPTYEGALHRFSVPVEVTERLTELSRAERVTRFMTILAALQALLHRYSGEDDIIVGTDVANRNRAEVEGLIGFFINHLVLRTDLSGQPTFRQLLRRVREVTLAAYAHQDLPFDRLVSALRPQRDLRPAPLFQVLLVMGNQTLPTIRIPGLTIRPVSTDLVLSKYDLTLFMTRNDQALSGVWRYRTELFHASTIGRLAEDFQQLLSQAAVAPDTHLGDFVVGPRSPVPVGKARQRRDTRATRRKAIKLHNMGGGILN